MSAPDWYVPAGAEDQPAGDGGEPTSAIAGLEQEPVDIVWVLIDVRLGVSGPLRAISRHGTTLTSLLFQRGAGPCGDEVL
jgi:hypothetical protein